MRFQIFDLPKSGLCGRVRTDDSANRSPVQIVFLHGLGCTAGIWPLREPLPGPAHSVVFIDLPGHGRARSPMPSSLADTAELVRIALDELSVEQTILVGHSMGGLVALHVDVLLAERNLRTVLFSTGARFQNITRSLQAMRNHDSSWARQTVVPHLPRGSNSQIGRLAIANTLRVGRETMMAGLEALEGFDAVYDLPPLRPLRRTLVCGDRDKLVRSSESRRLARHLRSDTVVMAGVGHFPMVERRDLFCAELRRALAGNSDRHCNV